MDVGEGTGRGCNRETRQVTGTVSPGRPGTFSPATVLPATPLLPNTFQ